MSFQTSSADDDAAPLGIVIAAALPPLIAFNQTPAATLYNHLLALAGWGLVLLLWARATPNWRAAFTGPAAWALLLLLIAPLTSFVWRALPLSLALGAMAIIGAGLAVLVLAQGLSGAARAAAAEGLCAGLVLAGLASVVVSVVQVFLPNLADGVFIARSGVVGSAVGNLRQPNHLASLMMWSSIGAVFVAEKRRWPLLLPPLLFAFVFVVVLSASRTGYIGIGMLAVWGLVDRRLSRTARLSLLATPLMLGAAWWVMSIWSAESGHAFRGASRLAEGAGSPSRLAILRDAWALTLANPWLGVGWGEFNVAWSLTPFPTRPIAFFDHTHNLVSQLAVELGLPWAGVVLALLAWAIWKAWCDAFGMGARLRTFILCVLTLPVSWLLLPWALWKAWRAAPESADDALLRRAALMIVLTIGLHSLLEYPLWYAYFLLPACFALGLALPAPARSPRSTPRLWGLLGGGLIVGSLFAVWDYERVVAIYAPAADAPPLVQRIAAGQRSLFFSHQADYAAATSVSPGRIALAAARRTAFSLVDARLLMHWSMSLEATGDLEGARYLADRLREFRNPTGDTWFAACTEPASAPMVQCQPASGVVDWRSLR
ncbi:PglL family O-oligosaccharyltransferase [Roseateles cellulosilyticus]|uniref:Wzy polymerase domain-containing protein n=1 Tax=Pelomonas cellulosilytica TaxID=2906762 RepID=A0ABS8XUU3_9BURK|nr:O-antigen ligase family protein [Pelomonas sp. P8]MCE4555517.1 Wzy polymerase domain-containing protein [Pelomonas sp. P8]